MATVVDIVNLALAKIGDRANVTSIDPPEGSAQADHCARFYPIARDEALEAHDWTFASTYDTVAELVYDNPRWAHCYALPADCLVVRELVLQHGMTVPLDPRRPQWELATRDDTGARILMAQLGGVVSIRYTRRVTDPTRYSALFSGALQFLLASMLAGPVIKGAAGVRTGQAMYVAYQNKLGEAAVSDANQNRVSPEFVPSSIRARGHNAYDRRFPPPWEN